MRTYDVEVLVQTTGTIVVEARSRIDAFWKAEARALACSVADNGMERGSRTTVSVAAVEVQR